ncbi:MAG: hypothetical protein KGI98_12060 [Euryarchaeota archaeon]|nr:hypothetical protein [Euryarchaeota archaeon]MDE1881204.1 hypothetical protein [Euryarchaeota archaeon]
MQSTAQVPSVGADRGLGPVTGYAPSAPSMQHPAYRQLIEIVELQRAMRLSTSQQQRFFDLRELAVEWYSSLKGRLAWKKDDASKEDLARAKELIGKISSTSVPIAPFPNITPHTGNTVNPTYDVGSGTEKITVLSNHLMDVVKEKLTVDTEKKYLEAFNSILPDYAELRGLVAKHNIWNDRTVVPVTVSSNSMERILEQIDDRERELEAKAAPKVEK